MKMFLRFRHWILLGVFLGISVNAFAAVCAAHCYGIPLADAAIVEMQRDAADESSLPPDPADDEGCPLQAMCDIVPMAALFREPASQGVQLHGAAPLSVSYLPRTLELPPPTPPPKSLVFQI